MSDPTADRPGNLYADIPGALPGEVFTTLAKSDALEIERILSRGHTAPAAGWFDQDRHEWVVLLQGAARIEFEDDAAVRSLFPGDWLLIPAHRKHRVVWTEPQATSIWLAVHFT